MKHFLVVRDKNKNNLKIIECDTQEDAEKEKKKLLNQGHEGELVIGFAKSMKSFLIIFSEYRPPDWRNLLN